MDIVQFNVPNQISEEIEDTIMPTYEKTLDLVIIGLVLIQVIIFLNMAFQYRRSRMLRSRPIEPSTTRVIAVRPARFLVPRM